jgi:hypothetical protein
MDSLSDSSTSGSSGYSVNADTRSVENLTETTLKNAILPSGLQSPANSTPSETTRDPDAPNKSPSRVVISTTALNPQTPSIEEALSSPFIDSKAIGVQTWPITGMQKWEGRVLEVDGEIFSAELTPLDTEDDEVLISEFRTKALEAGEVGIQPGDLFYVTARPVRLRGLLVTMYSLQPRRRGNWTVRDVDEIQKRIQSRLEMLRDNVE